MLGRLLQRLDRGSRVTVGKQLAQQIRRLGEGLRLTLARRLSEREPKAPHLRGRALRADELALMPTRLSQPVEVADVSAVEFEGLDEPGTAST